MCNVSSQGCTNWGCDSKGLVSTSTTLHCSSCVELVAPWLQHEMMDFGIIVGCLVCLALPASGQLHAVKPAGRLMSRGVVRPVALLAALFAAEQGAALAVVHSMPWYDTNHQVSLLHLPAAAASIPVLDHTAALIVPWHPRLDSATRRVFPIHMLSIASCGQC